MSDITLKASLVPLTTLSFSGSDPGHIQQQLAQKQQDAPQLFKNLPCVLDLSELDSERITLADLKDACMSSGLLPVAVKNATADWHSQIQTLHLADLGKGHSKHKAPPESTHPEASTTEEKPTRAVKIHNANIRSGQQLYFDGDLFIFGMVSAGAEVLATGDIHIYGALRGKALAGAKGDEAAIISVQQFEAEMVAIAGQYRLFEQEHEQHRQTALIQLQEGNLNIHGLS